MQLIPSATIRLRDWSGFTDFGGSRQAHAPRNEAEVLALVRECRSQRMKLRVVGLQTSWSALWHCQDAMMTTQHLNAIHEIDIAKRTITCGSGVRLDTIHQALWAKGLCLETAPAVGWVTLGGAVSTGSHGSGPASISSSVVGARLVTGGGEILEIREGDARLDGVRLSMGLLGILTTITLRVTEAFCVQVKRTRIPMRDWKRFLNEGAMSFLLWFPHTESAVLMRVNVVAGRELARPPGTTAILTSPLEKLAAGRDLDKDRRALSELANIVPATLPARNRYLLDVFFQEAEAAGPAHEMLMSFQSQPIVGAEWAVPVTHIDAAMATLQEETTRGKIFLPVVWLKKVKGESAWLRAADGECVQCGIYYDFIEGTPCPVKDTVTRVERIMLRNGGRPHLGKLIYLTPRDLKHLYPEWGRFDVLRRQLDPQGMFWTEAIEARFGDAS